MIQFRYNIYYIENSFSTQLLERCFKFYGLPAPLNSKLEFWINCCQDHIKNTLHDIFI